MKAYDQAAGEFTLVLDVQSTNTTARYDRALANLNRGELDAARTDYLKLQETLTNAYQVAYGLGEIAWRKHETNEAVRNYTLYLANANLVTEEATNIQKRLKELKAKSP
jgi:hypothetical protein